MLMLLAIYTVAALVEQQGLTKALRFNPAAVDALFYHVVYSCCSTPIGERLVVLMCSLRVGKSTDVQLGLWPAYQVLVHAVKLAEFRVKNVRLIKLKLDDHLVYIDFF